METIAARITAIYEGTGPLGAADLCLTIAELARVGILAADSDRAIDPAPPLLALCEVIAALAAEASNMADRETMAALASREATVTAPVPTTRGRDA